MEIVYKVTALRKSKKESLHPWSEVPIGVNYIPEVITYEDYTLVTAPVESIGIFIEETLEDAFSQARNNGWGEFCCINLAVPLGKTNKQAWLSGKSYPAIFMLQEIWRGDHSLAFDISNAMV